ncbi:MAG: C4-type zinc ribbon domain-containing protein [Candidatus Omnitrophota bacterium]
MPTVNLKEGLKLLSELQKIDSQIYSLKEKKEVMPLEIKALEAAFEEKKQKLLSLEKSALEFQKQKKEKELELASKEEATKKLQGQLFALKTNKDYQTMLQQIASSKADASVIEDKILESFEKIDKTKNELESEKQNLVNEEKTFQGQKTQVQNKIKEVDEQLAQLESQRNHIIPGIAKNILSQYERVLSIRDGLAIVGIKDGSCLGCHMSVSPQIINLVQMYENIISCDICNRILYIEETPS